MGASYSAPLGPSTPYRILTRQPVGTVLQVRCAPLEPVLTTPPPTPRLSIPIPHELTLVPLFDTFFDLVDAHEAGGIETPTPAPLLASVHELVQCITSSESSPPETWALAREWRDAVRAAHFAANPNPNPPQQENETRGRPTTTLRRPSRAAQDLEKTLASNEKAMAVDEKRLLVLDVGQ
ncbi:hypothetical protein CspHIS471_0107110 [Cutaneotrichosporon sp. HIS471]|nr:hypothetical protein CspHIS471_0107110 [Cutaneotrichosporon sp. HIS471]